MYVFTDFRKLFSINFFFKKHNRPIQTNNKHIQHQPLVELEVLEAQVSQV